MENDSLNETKVLENDIREPNKLLILISCLLLGILFNILFFNKVLGLSYPLFIIAFYIVFIWSYKDEISFKPDFAWFLSIPILMLSACYMIFSNPIFNFFNFFAVPLLIVFQTTLLTGNNRYKWYDIRALSDIIFGFFNRPFKYFLKPFALFVNLFPKIKAGKFSTISKVILGILFAIPLLLFIGMLLSSADQIFAHYAALLLKIFPQIEMNEFMGRTILVIIITLAIFSYIWSQSIEKEKSSDLITQKGSLTIKKLDPIFVITVLVSINILYLVFTIIQFTYLFGGANFALPENFTFAEYARRGFFELVFVTIINLGILLVSINYTEIKSNTTKKAINILNSLLILCTTVMLYSAHFRMSLYESAYGYTYLRLLTHTFMVFLFALFIAALIKVWKPRMILLKSYIIISIIAYVAINYINVDAVIAKNNMKIYSKTKNIDTVYLTMLSYDAIPYIDELVNDKNKKVAIEIENYLYTKKEILNKENYWQAFNISKFNAKKVLDGYELKYNKHY